MNRLLTCCAALAFVLPGSVAAQKASSTITIGKVDSIWSPTLKEHRKIWIYTPPSYVDTSYQPQKYPVLYVLDGDAHFHSLTGLLQALGTGVNGTRLMPEMIVVAIPNTDRTRDMTPTRTERTPFSNQPQAFLKTSGGMSNFLRFIETELIPKIESNYRTAPYRVLVGHSFGGITAINALYTMPTVFNSYIAIDPSIWYDDQLLLKQARAQLGRKELAGRTLFVAHANTISPADTTANLHFNSITQFNRLFETENESGLRYAYKYYNDDDHGSVPLIAEYDALRFVFASYRLQAPLSQTRQSLTEHYARASRRLGYTVLPPEPMLNLLGGYLLSQADTSKALGFYELYAETYPGSARPFKALGDALAKREPARALGYYENALALDPRDEKVKKAIQDLRRGR